jgi:FG-GAP repeat
MSKLTLFAIISFFLVILLTSSASVTFASSQTKLSTPITLASPKAQHGGFFGRSVASSDGITIVGASSENAEGVYGAGRAYVFNSTTGDLISKLTSANPSYDGQFGFSVAAGKGIVAVGAIWEPVNGKVTAGRVYVFNPNNGKLIRTLTSPNAQYHGYFGWSVFVVGETVYVGAPDETSGNFGFAGNVYAFNGKTGALIQSLSSPDPQNDSGFGGSVAATAGIIVVGASGESVDGMSSTGQTYVFNSTTGALMDTLTSPNAESGGIFGWSVAAAGNNIAVVGAPFETVNGVIYAGRAYMFDIKSGSVFTLTSPNNVTTGNFGTSVAASGGLVAVGAPYDNSSGYPGAGSTYVFKINSSVLVASLDSPNAQKGGLFGYSVSLNEGVLIVGAPNENAGGRNHAGHAYIYEES